MKWLSYQHEGDFNYGILTPENKIIPAQTIFFESTCYSFRLYQRKAACP